MNPTSSTPKQPAADSVAGAQDVKAAFAGKLNEQQLQTAAELTQATAAAYPVAISTSPTMPPHLLVHVLHGETFTSSSAGVVPAIASPTPGTLYTNDSNQLYSATVAFQFTSTPGYFSIVFFDDHNNVLGVCQAATVLPVPAIGGGAGKWA